MLGRLWLPCASAVLISVSISPALFAQWLDYPTPGVPRTADGKPNLAAPAPRTADGKPDFTGMWGWETPVPCGAHCSDIDIQHIGREFLNIAYRLKGGLPYQPWAADLVQKRKSANAGGDPNVRCMPRGALRIWTDDYYKRIIQTPGRLVILTERNMQYRQIFTDGRALPVDRIQRGTDTPPRSGKETRWWFRPSVFATICGWTPPGIH